jgi:hypothetical protein
LTHPQQTTVMNQWKCVSFDLHRIWHFQWKIGWAATILFDPQPGLAKFGVCIPMATEVLLDPMVSIPCLKLSKRYRYVTIYDIYVIHIPIMLSSLTLTYASQTGWRQTSLKDCSHMLLSYYAHLIYPHLYRNYIFIIDIKPSWIIRVHYLPHYVSLCPCIIYIPKKYPFIFYYSLAVPIIKLIKPSVNEWSPVVTMVGSVHFNGHRLMTWMIWGYPLVNVYITNWKIIALLMGKSTFSMAIFNRKL